MHVLNVYICFLPDSFYKMYYKFNLNITVFRFTAKICGGKFHTLSIIMYVSVYNTQSRFSAEISGAQGVWIIHGERQYMLNVL